MPQVILYKNGAYNIFSTIVDAPLFEHALTLEQLTETIRHERGETGVIILTNQIERAHKTGCSGYGATLESCIIGNRAGDNETELSINDFIIRYLTLVA